MGVRGRGLGFGVRGLGLGSGAGGWGEGVGGCVGGWGWGVGGLGVEEGEGMTEESLYSHRGAQRPLSARVTMKCLMFLFNSRCF